MQFEWDEEKAKSNERKHGIDFITATRAFLDPNRREYYNGMHGDEERWSVLGSTEEYIIVMVVFTMRGVDEDIVRIISARRADKNEQRAYYHL